MSAHSENLGSIRPHRKRPHPEPDGKPSEQQPTSANHFVEVHQSHVPWEGEGIDVHEDERYAAPTCADEEGARRIQEHFRILHGDERPGPESRA